MAITFTHLSYWLWGTKDGHESTNSALNLSSDFPSGFRELDSVKFPSVKGTKMKSSSRRIKKKWQSREERRVRIDREYDVVIVPSDGGCLSGSESDDSDWSIGWIEPHAPEFQSNEGETDSSFAVLVPCYGRGRCEKKDGMKSRAFGTVTQHFGFSSEGTDSIERWLSSLHDM
ncbi:hypothetical protein IEQ34_009016 [Dendrobium chrysotoxum]|uniref:Uncharacterized protein n=1 Tax=Dendrobium chrysotoxum TaxID=161865 RepID=A0AAV7GXJ2_DENCH|nr:hypothetical protein IEQ34_009016 [Dendrobium chrysotoxum]